MYRSTSQPCKEQEGAASRGNLFPVLYSPNIAPSFLRGTITTAPSPADQSTRGIHGGPELRSCPGLGVWPRALPSTPGISEVSGFVAGCCFSFLCFSFFFFHVKCPHATLLPASKKFTLWASSRLDRLHGSRWKLLLSFPQNQCS